ncbi:MAG: PleD family two-component system response regulator [Candidatus Hydrothermarchaeales archaeon]
MVKILLIDDEAEILMLTRALLEKNGYKVETAKSGAEGLKKLEKELPDLILLDIMMPPPDGWEVCEKIKADKNLRHIPVAMFTVRTSRKSREKSLTHAKADAQIDKPFDIEGLLKTIEEMLG